MTNTVLYVESKKYNKLLNVTTTTKRNRLADTENELVVTSGKGGSCNIGVGGLSGTNNYV